MNRREALKAAVAAVATGGTEVVAKDLAVEPDAEPVAFVLKSKGRLSGNDMKHLGEQLKDIFAKTQWAEIPVLVLDERMDFDLMKLPKELMPPKAV